MNILVVEDDPRISGFLERGLRAGGYRVQLARTGPEGLALANEAAEQMRLTSETTVMLLDIMLPEMNGLEVCQALRSARVNLPILMLTALGSLEDRVSGLRLGADDYLVKPFEFEELLARIEALARRGREQAVRERDRLQVDDLIFDLSAMQVTRAGKRISLNLLQNFLYDRGAMLHGSFLANTSYALSLTNGTGVSLDEFQRNATEARADGKDLTLRMTANLARWLEQPRSVIHLGVNYKRGEVANGDATTAGYTAANGVSEGRGLVFFNPVTFNPGSAQAASSIDRRIGSLELALAHDRYKVQGEVARATYSGSLASGQGFERDITAGYLALSWLISGESFADAYRNAVFSRIRPRQDATVTDKWGGAWQASLRYSFFDGDDFRSTNAAHSGQLGDNTSAPQVTRSTSGAKAWTAALKWMASPNVALMLNYVRTHFDSPVVSGGKAYSREDAVTLRSQIDFF